MPLVTLALPSPRLREADFSAMPRTDTFQQLVTQSY